MNTLNQAPRPSLTPSQVDILMAQTSSGLARSVIGETLDAVLGDSETWAIDTAAGLKRESPAYIYSFLNSDGGLVIVPSAEILGPASPLRRDAARQNCILLASFTRILFMQETSVRGLPMPRYRYEFSFAAFDEQEMRQAAKHNQEQTQSD